MPYALFSQTEQVSRAYASKAEVWRHAAESGLVVEVSSGEEDPPRRILDMDYSIRECARIGSEVSDAPGMSEHDIAQLMASCSSRPSAAAAS